MLNYRVMSVRDDRVIIKDSGLDRSVTNSIEAVLKHVNAHVASLSARRFLYFDSVGELTEVLHDNGVFKAFSAPLSHS